MRNLIPKPGYLIASALTLLRTAFANTHCDTHRRAVEAEAFAELTLEVTTVARIQEAGGKQHDGRRLRICLGSKEHAWQTVVFHRRRVRSNCVTHPVIQLTGRNALIPAFQRL